MPAGKDHPDNMASQRLMDAVVDTTACDREPIHIPGAIQPHGLLLIADVQSLSVVAGAGALEERLSPAWLGADLSDLLDQDVAALIGDSAGPVGAIVAQPVVTAGGERLDVAIHRSDRHWLVELEPSAEQPLGAAAVVSRLDGFAVTFERASDLDALCARAASAFRQLTGFDRVMVYRFLDDDAGRVVAEDRDPKLGTFLNHHFPASDIPRQARALYIRNRARAIPTVDYTPAPIRPADYAGLDLSDIGIRSVSPIHLRYMVNMGVQASASISIVKDGLLWGLIACHHDTPKLLPPDVRASAATLASGLARQIRAKEEAETYRERLRLRAAEDAVLPKLAGDGGMADAMRRSRDDLMRMLDADGFAWVHRGGVDCTGHCPPADLLRTLSAWVQGGVEPVMTRELGRLRPDLVDHAGSASGMIAMPLADDGATLMWFRIEQVEEVEWAGNPHKQGVTPGEQLTPRASFETWTEQVRGRSRRWTMEEMEAAHRLRRAFHDAHRSRQLRDLNAQLMRTLADKDAALAQKDLLMKEVDHRVQNSLQLVSAFLAMQARAAGPGEVAEQLTEAQARLSAVALVHRRLYRDDQIGSVDLSRYLEELAGDMKASIGDEWASRMHTDLAPVLIPTDRAVAVGLVMTELVINATKYAYDGGVGPIAIILEQHRNRLRLIVADEGRGKSGDKAGFGSRMMGAMVGKLDGEIAFVDNAPGLRAILTAPIAAG